MKIIFPNLFLLFSIGVSTMFGIGKTCFFSNVKARLLLNGKPVVNAKVLRRWEWNELKSDVSYTDENGYVNFPVAFESSVSRLLPIELVISQGLLVYVDGEEKRFWTNSKREPEVNAEYGGNHFDVVCELSNEVELIEDYGSLMVTMCKLNKDN